MKQNSLSAWNYETLNRKELANLSITARDLFHFIIKFDKLHDIPENVTIYFIGDQLQSTEADTCGIFQFFFLRELIRI